MQKNVKQQMDRAEAAFRARIPGGFKPKQREVLAALAAGKNVCASLPTGYGKSLCFAVPAAAWRWRVWVLSPLVALMEDQAASLREMGISALAIHSALPEKEAREREGAFFRGEAQLVLFSPERLVLWERRGLLRQLAAAGELPELVALDEFHCFEEWRRFRPDFAEAVAVLRRLVGDGPQLLGLSATIARSDASAWMAEICASHEYVEGSLLRPELRSLVVPVPEEPLRWLFLLGALRGLKAPAAALVYCATREECDQVTEWLRNSGWPATAFHAGIPAPLRRERARAFRAGHLRVICATTAFGMGIDYPHVDRVVHFSLPSGLEAYWQEAGRAGRAGAQALAIAFWRRSEVARASYMTAEERERYWALWDAWAGGECRQKAVATRLQMVAERDCGSCDRCMQKNKIWPDTLIEWKELCEKSPWWLRESARPRAWMRDKILRAP